MTKLRFLSIGFFVIIFLYSILVYYANFYRSNNRLTPCQFPIIRSILPWDSACFYPALFDGKAHISSLYYEKYKLEIFEQRNGMNPHTLWYRMYFAREFKEPLEYGDNDVDHFYWRYQKTAPHRTEELAKYMNYLLDRDKTELAQNTLDKFCGLYIKKNQYGPLVIQSIGVSLKEYKVAPYNLHQCIGLLGEQDQPDWYRKANKTSDNEKN